jgi:hypothetical protein
MLIGSLCVIQVQHFSPALQACQPHVTPAVSTYGRTARRYERRKKNGDAIVRHATHCRAVLLAFSRDSTVATQAASAPNPIMTAQAPAGAEAAAPGTQQQQQRAYPPSGVLPFQGLSAYLAPLCYLYDSPAATYPVWHAMYCQYWCKLHAVSSSPAPAAGLPVLCRTFLDLLQVCV